MKRSTLLATSLLTVIVSVAAVGIGASMDMPRTLMSPADYNHFKRAIESDTLVSLAGCRTVPAPEKEVCRAQARAEERVKIAELSVRYHGTVTALDAMRQARARAEYDVARARCSAQPGDARFDCLRSARDQRHKTLAST